MSDFPELYLALPLERLPAIAAQLDVTHQEGLESDLASYASQHRDPTAIARAEQAMYAVAARVHGICGLGVGPIFNSEHGQGISDAFYGVMLHSTYTGSGSDATRKAAISILGYVITPDVLAEAAEYRTSLAAIAPAFAEAQLIAYDMHW